MQLISCDGNEFKTNARSNSIANSKYPIGFDKVLSSGMFSSYFFQVNFPLMMEFIVPRNLVPTKHMCTLLVKAAKRMADQRWGKRLGNDFQDNKKMFWKEVK